MFCIVVCCVYRRRPETNMRATQRLFVLFVSSKSTLRFTFHMDQFTRHTCPKRVGPSAKSHRGRWCKTLPMEIAARPRAA